MPDPTSSTAPARDAAPAAFANILLSGPCNLRCPDCIGRQLGPPRPANLHLFPLRGLDAFCARLAQDGVREVSLTGVDTDPLLYRHQPALVAHLRARVPGVRLSLHSNGQLALARLDLVHLYDRAAISVPSLDPAIYAAMIGGGRPLELRALLARCRIPLKVSVLATRRNLAEIPSTLAGLRALGVRRAVLRRAVGEPLPQKLLPGLAPVRHFGGNPVYALEGLEVTDWRFDATSLGCLNLYSDGTIDGSYRLRAA